MKAVILAGGLGTRLREETEFRPKPMVEIGGKPILWHIMKNLSAYDINEFIVCVGYRGDIIKDYFLNYASRNSDLTISLGTAGSVVFYSDHQESSWTVTIADTGASTNTGGRVKLVQQYLRNEKSFIVTYGDGVADVNIAELVRFHVEHGRIATVTTVQPPTRFGRTDVNAQDEVESFREKPVEGDWVSAGFFIFDQKVFGRLNEDTPLEYEPLQGLARDRELMAYKHRGFFQPMDTYREVQLLNELWNAGDAPWKIWHDS